MKNLKWLVVGMALMFSAPTFADCGSYCDPCDNYDDCCNFCDWSLCDWDYSVYADLLYWEPCRSALDYDDNGDTKYLDPGYDLGWRIGMRAQGECGDFHIRYTSFNNDYNTSWFESSIEHDRKYDLDYRTLDIELGTRLSFCCDKFNLRPFIGAKLAWIDEKTVNTEDSENDSLDHSAYGLVGGFEAQYKLCGGFSLVGRGEYAVLRASLDHKYHDEGSSRGDECHYVTNAGYFVGAQYEFDDICGCGDWDTSLAIGYENTVWDLRESDHDHHLTRLGLGGLTVRLSVGF